MNSKPKMEENGEKKSVQLESRESLDLWTGLRMRVRRKQLYWLKKLISAKKGSRQTFHEDSKKGALPESSHSEKTPEEKTVSSSGNLSFEKRTLDVKTISLDKECYHTEPLHFKRDAWGNVSSGLRCRCMEATAAILLGG